MNEPTREGQVAPETWRGHGPSVNQVTLIGRIAADPDVRFTADGAPVVRLRVATHYQDRTDYHTLVAFGQQAKFAAEFLTKGRLIYAEGRLQARQWTSEDGTPRRSHELVAQMPGPQAPTVIGTLVVLRVLWDLSVGFWLIALSTGRGRLPAHATSCLSTVLRSVGPGTPHPTPGRLRHGIPDEWAPAATAAPVATTPLDGR